jgi:hypothetical protein
MDMFNNFIGDHCLREVIRAGPRYTWTNKQDDPIMVNLDRFLVAWNGSLGSLFARLGA